VEACALFCEGGNAVIKKEMVAGTDQVWVTFAVPSTTWADRVNLVGEFNAWDPTATPMFQTRADANWQVTIHLKPGQCYRFRYLIDGQEWLNDWNADGFFYDSMPHGFCDSVVDLTQIGVPAPVSLS
jgi:1,4-alpha-glucan branching enzyme